MGVTKREPVGAFKGGPNLGWGKRCCIRGDLLQVNFKIDLKMKGENSEIQCRK